MLLHLLAERTAEAVRDGLELPKLTCRARQGAARLTVSAGLYGSGLCVEVVTG